MCKCTTPFGISRDVVVHAFGANCMSELNAIVIVTKSVEEYEGADIPRVSGGFFNGRCEVKHMYAVTYLLSPTSAEVGEGELSVIENTLCLVDPQRHMAKYVEMYSSVCCASRSLYA